MDLFANEAKISNFPPGLLKLAKLQLTHLVRFHASSINKFFQLFIYSQLHSRASQWGEYFSQWQKQSEYLMAPLSLQDNWAPNKINRLNLQAAALKKIKNDRFEE